MNLNAEMIPGLAVLLVGALFTFLADRLCRRKESVVKVKLLGALLAFVGAILVFIS